MLLPPGSEPEPRGPEGSIAKGKERPKTDVQDKLDSSQAQIDETLQRFANGFSWLRRAPVLHSPSEHGLQHEDVTFPARDGVPLLSLRRAS